MANLVTLTGVSGSQYQYEVCNFLGNWIELPGNYAFAYPNGQSGWRIPYIGQAKNLRERMNGHEKWAVAHSLGARFVLAHVNHGGEGARLAEEADLIRAYNPPLNVQERAPAAGFGRDRARPGALLLGG